MRTSLILRAAIGCGTLLAAGGWSLSANAAEQLPSLSAAINSDGAQLWPAGDAPSMIFGPVAAGDPLAPIPMNDADLAAEAAAAAGAPCSSCGGARGPGFYNRCGCNPSVFPWIRGPGNCDNWCVGPHWDVQLDGMFIHRDNANWASVVNNIGLTPSLLDQFDYGPGVRLFATGYNYTNYGVQVGYEGVNDFRANALFPGRSISYDSSLNSIEANVMRRTPSQFKIFAGARFIDFREDYDNLNTTTSDSNRFIVENQLMGFQIGALRDAWQLNKWLSLEPYGNAGVYLNNFKREDLAFVGSARTDAVGRFTEMAFVGEAGLNAIVRINRCLALRAGYQAMVLDRVGQALDASLAPGLNPQNVVFQGARFGVEYRR
jgi:hypothetical protein